MTDTVRRVFDTLSAQFEDLTAERDQLAARVAELEGTPLTSEQQANIGALADRLVRAADSYRPSDDADIDHHLPLFLRILAGNIRGGARFSPMLLRRADKLAAVMLGEDTARG